MPPTHSTEHDSLFALEAQIHSRIRGQDQAISRVCSVLERGELGLSPSDRPKGSMLFLGPTGVGKTELTLAFSEYLFGKEKLFRFDMSEFQHEDAVKLLLGDEAGKAGRLGRVLDTHGHGTLLFDEMEKANPLILDVFLQILDAARITTGNGTIHNLSNWYVVFTSNIGSAEIMGQSRLPFTTVERFVMAKLQQELRPEFIARFQEIVVFRKLSPEVQREIVIGQLEAYLRHLAEKLGIHLQSTPEAVEFLIRHGFHRTLGARPLRNAVLRYVGDAIRLAMRFGKTNSGALVVDGSALAVA